MLENYSRGHGIFFYVDKTGNPVLSHGSGDRGIVRPDNSVLDDIDDVKDIKRQTADLLQGNKQVRYKILSASVDKIDPKFELTDKEFLSIFDDPSGYIRTIAVQSPHFGPGHMEKALADTSHWVRINAVQSPHFGPQHMEKALADPYEYVREAAKKRLKNYQPPQMSEILTTKTPTQPPLPPETPKPVTSTPKPKQTSKPVTPSPELKVEPSVPKTGMLSRFKLPSLGQVADVFDINSPAAVTTGAVVDLAKANWDAIKTTPSWAAEKMGQTVETPDPALPGQL